MRARFLWRAYRARLADQAAELSLIRRHIDPSGLACDVGANKGSYLYWLSKWSARVVAFEPQPGLAQYLRDASQAVGMRNVTVEQRGVARQTGSLDFYVPDPNSPEASLRPITGAAKITIPVVALDDYFAKRDPVQMLKIDVEGAEIDVFKGAERILTNDRPVVLFECEQRHIRNGSVSDCFDLLEGLGYDGWYIQNGVKKPICEFVVDRDQAQVGDRFWREPGYSNNFLFVPKRPQSARLRRAA